MARTRNLLFVSLALAGLMFGVSDSAQAAFITGGPFNGTDVGAVDTLMGQLDSSHPCIAAGGSINGGNPGAEECWAESLGGVPALTFSGKTDPVTAYQTDGGPNVLAFQLASSPGYYIVKNSTHRALLLNLGSLGWGVVNTGALAPGFNLSDNQLRISHVTEFNGTPVPEPSTLLLLGAGLAMVGLRRRGSK